MLLGAGSPCPIARVFGEDTARVEIIGQRDGDIEDDIAAARRPNQRRIRPERVGRADHVRKRLPGNSNARGIFGQSGIADVMLARGDRVVSAPVRAKRMPGIARAFAASMARRACAWGERSTAACSPRSSGSSSQRTTD